MKPLWERMREAADTLEEASRVYGYIHPEDAWWTPKQLRTEAVHVEDESRKQDNAERYWHAGYGWRD